MVNEKLLLSIIITSYTTERLKDIFQLLDSLNSQTYHNIEIIFVAEKSRELMKKVKEYSKNIGLPRFKVIFNDGEPGASAARNLGIKSAKGEIIAFIDDDAVPFPDWAEKMIKTYEDDSIIGVTGPAYPLWEDLSMSWLQKEFHWIVSCTSWFNCNDVKEVRNVWLENASFRRESFVLAGYFDTKLGPQDSLGGFKQREFGEGIISEEVELSLRIKDKTGMAIVYNPEMKVWHKVRKNRLRWKYIIKWSYWTGFSKRKLKKLHPKDYTSTDILSQEHRLLGHIFSRVFPDILESLFKNPVIAWRKLFITITVLLLVALGYYFPILQLPIRDKAFKNLRR